MTNPKPSPRVRAIASALSRRIEPARVPTPKQQASFAQLKVGQLIQSPTLVEKPPPLQGAVYEVTKVDSMKATLTLFGGTASPIPTFELSDRQWKEKGWKRARKPRANKG